jgi:hypothetical protein
VNAWKIILATVVIFAAGVFTGGFLVNCIDRSHRPHHPPQSASNIQRPPEINEHPEVRPLPEPPLARQMSKDFLKRLDDKLQLTPEQHAKIEKIIADGQERNHELWTNVAPKMRAVMLDVNHQIREQLSAGQQKDFEELLKQFHPPRRPQNTNAPPVFSPTNSPATNAP